MSARGAVVHVEHKHGDDDGQSDEDHGEEEVLANEGDDEGRGWYDLRDEQKEDGEGQQHRDTKSDLLTTVWGQIENQHSEAGDQQAGDDEVDGVKEREPSNDEEVGDVWVDLMATVVFLGVVRPHSIDDGPFPALPVVVEIHGVLNSLQVNLGFVISPGAKFHFAVLLIEGEEGDVDAAGALVNGWRDPADFARVEQVSFCHMCHSKFTISTGGEEDEQTIWKHQQKR